MYCVSLFMRIVISGSARAIDEYGDLEEHIDEFMHQTDKRRRIYYENYTNQRWGDRENYDLMLNSGRFGKLRSAWS